jgi:DNA-binding NarL/FixJ family response regulator
MDRLDGSAMIHVVNPSILIVDDHPRFRAFARALLQADGFTVVGESGDGASALAATERLRPDVVLLDIQLPDIDGFEVARQLLESRAAPPLVFTSSRDASDYGERVQQSGARGFIPKAELSGAAIRAFLGLSPSPPRGAAG